jgi:hypothetical protein
VERDIKGWGIVVKQVCGQGLVSLDRGAVKAPSRSTEAPVAITEGILKGNKFSLLREAL